MLKQSAFLKRVARHGIVAMLLGAAMWVAATQNFELSRLTSSARGAQRWPTGAAQLVARESLGAFDGPYCQWLPASAGIPLAAQNAATQQTPEPQELDRSPLRVIRDTYPTYSAVAVDLQTNEVYLQDENLFGYKVFNRLDNTPPNAAFTEPKRIVAGMNTEMEFNCALYVDQATGDVYSVNNDTVNTMVVFPRNAEGNVKPMRELHTPHGTYGIAADEVNQELYLTVQHDNAVVVYNKIAEGDADPIRLLQGDNTHLEDPHGIAVDTKNNWIFVSNHGSVHDVRPDPNEPIERENWPLDRDRAVPGTGRSEPPSISVYSRTASGDMRPLRVIEGPRTQLNWPAALAVNMERGELYVANDADNSVLVFRATDQGDVAPTRVIRGPQTGLKNPTGLFLDTTNGELWVSSMGNHRATVYTLDANGNVPPKRTIRSAPQDKLALAIGNPGAVSYDPSREEILVPN
jgi:DNA-binding beta-propeller fold protein YncE